MASIIGIDLGTTNSAIAVLDRTGRPSIIENADGENVTPSVVYFEPGGDSRAVVGTAAKSNELLGDGRVFKEFKRKMPSAPAEPLQAGGIAVTPIQLSSLVLRKLLQDAAARLGDVSKVVVTIPANFANEGRLATMRAGELAGYPIHDIVNEPTAALFYYSFDRPISGTVMVYDFGGGTLDVTVARVNGRQVEIITSKGDPKLGGADFDRRLADLIAQKYEQSSQELFDSNVHSLGKSPEEYKKLLSAREDVAVQVVGGLAGRVIFKVTRDEFERATATLVSKADLLVESVLEEADLRPADVKDVFLVGGSTRMPMIRGHLTSLFGKDPVCHVNPDEVVALGAALYAGFKADHTQLNAAQASAVGAMQLKEVANHFFGTVSLHVDDATGRPVPRVSTLIEKNTFLPCSKTESYYTVHDGQMAVNCRVTQSATRESDPDFVRVIWQGDLGPLPAGRPANMEIRVTYAYDANQIMHCVFEDVASGLRQEVKIGLKGEQALAGQSIDQFLVE